MKYNNYYSCTYTLEKTEGAIKNGQHLAHKKQDEDNQNKKHNTEN